MDNWVNALINIEHNRFENTIAQLGILRQAVINTTNASCIKLTLAKLFGYYSCILTRNDSGKFIPHDIVKYKFKYYYIPDENTPTDLHS